MDDSLDDRGAVDDVSRLAENGTTRENTEWPSTYTIPNAAVNVKPYIRPTPVRARGSD